MTWPSNYRSREYQGQPFGSIPRLRSELPRQFDDATNRTVALIDGLWLHRNGIVGAFELESPTSVYSGLLRMSDRFHHLAAALLGRHEVQRDVEVRLHRPAIAAVTGG